MKSEDARRLPDRDQQSPESTPTCCHGSQDHTLLWNNYCCQLGGLLKPGARNSQDDHNQQKYDMRTQMSLFKATACNYSFFWTDLLSCKQKQHLGRSTTMNFLGTINFFNPNGILLVNSTFLSHCQTGVWDSVGSPSCCIDNFSDQSQAVRLYVCTLPLKTLFLVRSNVFAKTLFRLFPSYWTGSRLCTADRAMEPAAVYTDPPLGSDRNRSRVSHLC